MRSLTAVVAVGAVSVIIAGCGSAENAQPADSPPSGPAVPVASGPNSSQLQTELLGISEFPTGWRGSPVDTSPDDGRNPFTCSLPQPKPRRQAEAEADFANGEIEQFDETLDSYATAAEAKAAFDAGVKYTASCTGGKINGVTLTIAPLSIPKVGDDTYGAQLNGTIEGIGVAFDIAYSLNGQVIVEVFHVDTAPIDSDFTASQLKAAAAKVAQN